MLPVGDAIETFSDFLPYITGEYGVCKYGSFDMARLELQDDHYIIPFVEGISKSIIYITLWDEIRFCCTNSWPLPTLTLTSIDTYTNIQCKGTALLQICLFLCGGT